MKRVSSVWNHLVTNLSDEMDLQDESDPSAINQTMQKRLISKAEKALEISDGKCIEAYNALALYKAKSFEEALNLYRQAQAQYKEYYSSALEKHQKEMFRSKKKKAIWYNHDLRQFMRSVIGEANCLRKMGKYEQALEALMRCYELDSENHYGWISYINYQYHIPECLMRLGRWREAKKFMKKNLSLFDSASAKVLMWSYALCQYVLKHMTPFTSCLEYASWTGENQTLKHAIGLAAVTSPLVYEYLMGIRKLAPIRISKTLRSNSMETVPETSQLQYISDHLDLWLSVPGALDWAFKNCNTLYAEITMRKKENMLKRKNTFPNDPYRNLIKLYSRNWLVNSKIPKTLSSHNNGDHTLLHSAIELNNIDILRLLLDNLALVNNSTFGYACKLDREKVVQVLCERTNPVIIQELKFQGTVDPLEIVCSSGLWATLKSLLIHVSKTKLVVPQNVLHRCMLYVLNSTEYDCMHGGKTCNRCMADKNFKHLPSANFEKCIDIIMMFGWDSFKELPNLESFKKKNLTSRLKKINNHLLALSPYGYSFSDADVGLVIQLNKYNYVATYDQMTSELLKDIGNDEFQQGKYTEALIIYKKALNKNDKPEIKYILHSNIAQCYINIKQYKSALEHANKCIEENPSFVKGYARKATALEMMDRKTEALEVLEIALSKEPNNDLLLKLKQEIEANLEQPKMHHVHRHRRHRDICPDCGKERRIPKICGSCGEYATMYCGACRNVRYCSEECQREDWDEHKYDCCWAELHQEDDSSEDNEHQ